MCRVELKNYRPRILYISKEIIAFLEKDKRIKQQMNYNNIFKLDILLPTHFLGMNIKYVNKDSEFGIEDDVWHNFELL